MNFNINTNTTTLKMPAFYYVLTVSLLFGILQPTVCFSSELLLSRPVRSSYKNQNPNLYKPKNSNNVVDNQTNSFVNNAPQDTPLPAQQTESLDYLIGKIFITDNSSTGIVRFNTTFSDNHSMPNSRMHEDSPFANRSSQQEQQFKVQRTSDGKLNLVFNDILLSQRTVGTQTPKRNAGAIIFKDRPDSSVPTCDDTLHDGKPFCTEVRNYPDLTNFESKLLDEFSKRDLFFTDQLIQPTDLSQRTSIGPEESYMCKSEEKIIYPKAYATKGDELLFIANDNNKFKQGIRVEQCLQVNTKCEYADLLPNFVTATCKQNYIYRSLVAITANGTVTTDQFPVPSCCKCVLSNLRGHSSL